MSNDDVIDIVDDHIIVRKRVEALLETREDFRLVGKASSGSEALRLCSELQPDIVLMDLVMPDMDGVTAIKRLHDQHPAYSSRLSA